VAWWKVGAAGGGCGVVCDGARVSGASSLWSASFSDDVLVQRGAVSKDLTVGCISGALGQYCCGSLISLRSPYGRLFVYTWNHGREESKLRSKSLVVSGI
jgi:hypothetical protein